MEILPKSGAGIPDEGRSALLSEALAAELRVMIATDVLPGGEKLTERHLAERLQVSRTPLREALKILAGDGLVTMLPNRGAVVVTFTPAQVLQRLEVLGLIEGHAGALACAVASDQQIAELRALHHDMLAAYERRDRTIYFQRNQAIHAGLVAASGNASLQEVQRLLNRQLFRYRYQASQGLPSWDAAVDEHGAIMALLTRRDGEALRPLLQQHVRSTWDLLYATAPLPSAAPPAGPADAA